MSYAMFLKTARKGDGPPSDITAEKLEDAGASIAQNLQMKGFCVITDQVEDAVVQEAVKECDNMGWYQPAVLAQEGLLGVEGSNEVAKIEYSDFNPASAGRGLEGVDQTLWKLCLAVSPYQDQLGFRCTSRSNCILHRAGMPDVDETDLTDEEANDWYSIFVTRKLMMLVFLGPDAGTLDLKPFDEEANPIEVALQPGCIVIVRTDQLSFSISIRGHVSCNVATSFMLQPDVLRMHRNKLEEHLTPATTELDGWIENRLREIKEKQAVEEEDDIDVPRNFSYAANRTWFNRQLTSVRGVAARGAVTWEAEVNFLSLTHGADLVIQVPFLRWDHSPIYDPEPNSWQKQPPKTDCKHASFMDGIELFDNKLFGLSLTEVKGMDPQQRVALEVTYESLHRSGMKKNTLLNSTCGMYVGTAQSEWNNAERSADVGIFGATGGAPSITAGRLSFCLGCKGASLAIDTEAASGLSATYWACESVEKKGTGAIQDLACGIGVHLCLAKSWWPAHSAAGFLCGEGRCFSFDASAHGHVRSEGVGTVVVRHASQVVDGNDVEEKSKIIGTVVGAACSNNGRSAGMTAPNGPAEQLTLLDACRRSGILPNDVDSVECHAAGGFLRDAVEVASCGKALRGGKDSDDVAEVLQLGSGKANVGNAIEQAGINGFFKSLFTIRWGIQLGNVHLQQLNPHLDLQDCPVTIGNEITEFRSRSVFTGTSAYGFGGTNVHIQCFGCVDDETRPVPEATPEEDRPRITYWPGGGGDLGSDSRPRSGFFVVGTFNKWHAEAPMKDEGDGCYVHDVTLGVNGWEQFTIQLDGDSNRVLHPHIYKAAKGTEVSGPVEADGVGDGAWMIDGRRAVPVDAPALADAQTQALAVLDHEDRGSPGDQYRICLAIAGKWRTVTWSKIEGSTPSAPSLGKYYITGNFNDWKMEEMLSTKPGVFSIQVSLTYGGGEFKVVRDMDMRQVVYPAMMRAGPSAAILGPDDFDGGNCWFIDSKPTEQYRIEFQRCLEGGKDLKSVAWQLVGK